MKRLILAVLPVFLLASCASLGSARKQGTKSYLVVHAGLVAISEAEPRLVCGRATAAPAPACIPLDVHHTISAKIEQAALTDKAANALLMDLPASDPQPAEVTRLLVDLSQVINEVMAMIPSGPTKTELRKITEVE